MPARVGLSLGRCDHLVVQQPRLLLTVTATTDEEGSDIDWTEALAGNGFRVDQLRNTPYGATNAPDGFIGSGQLIPLWDVIGASWQTGVGSL